MTADVIVQEILKLLPPSRQPVSVNTIRNQLRTRLSRADPSSIESAITLAAAKGLIERLNGGAVLTRAKSPDGPPSALANLSG
jgi:Fe2+ or Zn2+ uptake regulation protein